MPIEACAAATAAGTLVPSIFPPISLTPTSPSPASASPAYPPLVPSPQSPAPASLSAASPAADRAALLPPRAGWDRLVRRHRRRLLAVARRAFHQAGAAELCAEAEDLVQDVWCRLLQRRDSGTCGAGLPPVSLDEARLGAYLESTARHLAIDRAREHQALKRGGHGPRRARPGRCRSKVRRPVAGEVRTGWSSSTRPATLGGAEAARELVAVGPSPEERVLRREERDEVLRRCRPYVSQYHGRDLAILERALLDGWSSRQIAGALRQPVSASAVDTLVHRVRRGLAAEGVELPRRL